MKSFEEIENKKSPNFECEYLKERKKNLFFLQLNNNSSILKTIVQKEQKQDLKKYFFLPTAP